MNKNFAFALTICHFSAIFWMTLTLVNDLTKLMSLTELLEGTTNNLLWSMCKEFLDSGHIVHVKAFFPEKLAHIKAWLKNGPLICRIWGLSSFSFQICFTFKNYSLYNDKKKHRFLRNGKKGKFFCRQIRKRD